MVDRAAGVRGDAFGGCGHVVGCEVVAEGGGEERAFRYGGEGEGGRGLSGGGGGVRVRVRGLRWIRWLCLCFASDGLWSCIRASWLMMRRRAEFVRSSLMVHLDCVVCGMEADKVPKVYDSVRG